MSGHAVTLHLPETLYKRFRQRADWTHRSLETELLDAVAAGAPVEDELSPETLESIAALEHLGDDELWRLARQAMSREASQELEALHAKQRDQGLDPSEDATRARLIHEYERAMLIRAQVVKLLKSRGHDVSSLLTIRKQSRTAPEDGGLRTPLGSRLSARFAGIGLDEEIPELRDQPARPALEPRPPSRHR